MSLITISKQAKNREPRYSNTSSIQPVIDSRQATEVFQVPGCDSMHSHMPYLYRRTFSCNLRWRDAEASVNAWAVDFSIRNPLAGDSMKRSLHQTLSELTIAMAHAWTGQCS
jgi:trehalose utilization protein